MMSLASQRALQVQSHPGRPRACRHAPVRSTRTRKVHVVHATAAPQQKPAVAVFADNIGLPTDEGLFGFKPFAEVWCGRLAMMGFLTSMIQEFTTGQGTLAQIGVEAPSSSLLWFMIAFFGTATAIGAGVTGYRAVTKKMSVREITRLKKFLGLNNPNDFMVAADDMKRRGDFTTPGYNFQAINESRASGSAADSFLSLTNPQADVVAAEQKAAGSVLTLSKEQEAAEVEAAAAGMKSEAGPSVSLAAKADIEEQLFFNSELRYARSVELTNGRWAMMGFLAAILVEAATGNGIIMQGISYLKWMGVLGPMSGF